MLPISQKGLPRRVPAATWGVASSDSSKRIAYRGASPGGNQVGTVQAGTEIDAEDTEQVLECDSSPGGSQEQTFSEIGDTHQISSLVQSQVGAVQWNMRVKPANEQPVTEHGNSPGGSHEQTHSTIEAGIKALGMAVLDWADGTAVVKKKVTSGHILRRTSPIVPEATEFNQTAKTTAGPKGTIYTILLNPEASYNIQT
ncbi:hypothetical protein DL95DRAFT_455549 [Leptodontidium sp. 2 PMI_412]|nr:hypothetical protein DL95DRAFT_455549 [Leptodontidium sp. 2 PMI_412]